MFELRFGQVDKAVEVSPPIAPSWTFIDVLSQVNEFIGHLAWPLVALAIAFIFRKQIKDLLHQVEKFEAPGGFSVALNKARKIAEESAVIEVEAVPEIPNQDNQMYDLANAFPEAAVLKYYQEVEKYLLNLNGTLDLDLNPVTLMMALRGTNTISEDAWELYESIRRTRNAAVHSEREVTSGEAIEFGLLTAKLMQILEKCILPVDINDLQYRISKWVPPTHFLTRRQRRKRST